MEAFQLLVACAIGLSEQDMTPGNTDEQWFEHRLQLVKNLMNSDSLDKAELVLQRCLASTPTDSTVRCEVLMVKGSLHFRRNAFHKADSTFSDALTCLRGLTNVEALIQMGYLSLGYTRTALAEYADALEAVDAGEALSSGEKMYPSVANGLLRLRAEIHHQQGRYADALREYEACLQQLRSSGSDQMPVAISGLADVLLDLAQPQKAGPLAEEALTLIADTLTDILPSQTSVLNTAAYTNYVLGNLDLASARYARSIDVCEAFGATRTMSYAQALNGQALVEMARSRLDRADTLFVLAYKITVSIQGVDHPFTARVMINQAELRIKQRRPDEARQLLIAAQPITQRFLGNDHDQLGDIHRTLGDLTARTGDRTQASIHYQKALRIYLICFPESHPKVQSVRARA